MKKRFFIIFICCIQFIFIDCKSTQSVTPALYGMIYNSENEPIPDVSIFVNDKKSAVSDIYGHFQLENVKLNESYSLRASKEGFEDTLLNFSFTNVSQVAYLRMFSFNELLSETEKKIIEKKYTDALELLERAEKIYNISLSVMYLKAVVYYLTEDYNKALASTEIILQNKFDESYVYLLLADIYEYGFNDRENTKKYLQLSLNKLYDPDVYQRLSSLE